MDTQDFFEVETTFSIKRLPAFRAVDPVSAFTHFLAFILCIIAFPPLLVKAAIHGVDFIGLMSLSIYMMTMIMLYGASSAYHTFNTSTKTRKILKRLDHFMIYMMIAGSYTPMCTMVLGIPNGLFLLILVWSVTLIGLIQTIFFVDCKKWVSSLIYIAMGWLALLVVGKLISLMTLSAFIFLVLGGVFYTVGGIVYAFKFSLPGELFGAHELFHIFVMLGSLMHFIMMFCFIVI